MDRDFHKALRRRIDQHQKLVGRKNRRVKSGNGVFDRWRNPVLTAGHTPLFWRYDIDPGRNPFLQERLGVHSVSSAGAIEWQGRTCLVARVEGHDGRGFFAVAESATGTDGFRFRDHPVVMPETEDPDVDVSDMRLTAHEDGWVYGVFRATRRGPDGTSSEAASIARTRDLVGWERLADLEPRSEARGSAVLHPELVAGRYALYTRPLGALAGSRGGSSLVLCETIERAEISGEMAIDHAADGDGPGPPPLKTPGGWLHIAHGTRETGAGRRSVLRVFLCALDDPSKVIARPGGDFLTPKGEERVGDIPGAVLCGGALVRPGGEVLLYYGASCTRVHVATTSVDRLLDYVLRTPEDPLSSAGCVRGRIELIDRNLKFLSRVRGRATDDYQGLS